MAGQINISGSTEAVQLHGNDDYTVARDFTFPDESGELLIKTANGNVPGVGAINNGPLAGMRNAIINGDFRVWQRGNANTTGAPNDPYVADRWKLRSSTTAGGILTGQRVLAGNLNKFQLNYLNNPSTGLSGLWQTIEAQNVMGYIGKELTISCYCDFEPRITVIGYAASPDTGKTLLNKVTPTSLGNNRYSVTFTFTTNDGQVGDMITEKGLDVFIQPPEPIAVGNYEIWNVQLEPGPVATPFEMRPIGTEFALCQRYYIASQFAIQGNAINGGIVANWIQFPTLMRTTPDAVISQMTKFPAGIQDPVVSTTHNNGIRIGVTNNTGANQANIAIGSAYTADAEL